MEKQYAEGAVSYTNPPTEELPFFCGEMLEDGEHRCQRRFKSQPALNMHRVRKHSGKTWSTTGNFAGKKLTRKQQYKRDYDLRKKQQKAGLEPRSLIGINFCPECGCNLQVYNVARAAAERINEG
jgi:hypothetical protein